jgi:hypothetical protein
VAICIVDLGTRIVASAVEAEKKYLTSSKEAQGAILNKESYPSRRSLQPPTRQKFNKKQKKIKPLPQLSLPYSLNPPQAKTLPQIAASQPMKCG